MILTAIVLIVSGIIALCLVFAAFSIGDQLGRIANALHGKIETPEHSEKGEY